MMPLHPADKDFGVSYEEDRQLVSSVIKNRLEEEMLLQIDAAVLYALQKRKSQVLLIGLNFCVFQCGMRTASCPVGS